MYCRKLRTSTTSATSFKREPTARLWSRRAAAAIALMASTVALATSPATCTTSCHANVPSSIVVSSTEPIDLLGTSSVSGSTDLASWCEAVVIVLMEDGFGSGAIISADGWVLTNYHVVESAVQTSAMIGEPAQVLLTRCHVFNGRVRSEGIAHAATVFKADPYRDLALLKFYDESGPLPHLSLAAAANLGEACYAIGSQGDGIPWGIKQGNVAALVRYPEHTTNAVVQRTLQPTAQGRTLESLLERINAEIVYTTCPISLGDSGGPLVNSRGELIGLTFATPSNLSMGSSGYHIALSEINAFIADTPEQPQGVPLDVLSAGLPTAERVPTAFLIDGDKDGRVEAVEIAFVDSERSHIVASLVLVDLDGEILAPGEHESVSAALPAGLWGATDGSGLAFDMFIFRRIDGAAAIGFTDVSGQNDEILIDADGDTLADTRWQRFEDGSWAAVFPRNPTAMVDTTDELSSSEKATIKNAMRLAYEPGMPILQD